MREYITKLNDRNLQRKKATGITNYVLYSLIFIIIFKIIDLVRIINFRELETLNFIKLTWYSFCLSLALYFTYFSFVISFNNSSSLRILKKSKKEETYFLNILISSFFLSTIIPAAIILWHQDFGSNNYITRGFEYFLFGMTAINLIALLFVLFSKNNDLFKTINKNDKNDIFSKITFAVSFLVILSSVYLLVITDVPNKINLVLLCLLIFSILAIFEKIIESHKDDMFSKDLENLEYEIFLKDLSDNDIRDILQKKYMGFLINDWINFKESEISNELEKFKIEIEEIQFKEKEIENIDKNKYPIEYKGRKEKIIELRTSLENKKKRFFESNINEINEVLKKDSRIKLQDLNKLKDLIIQISSKNP